MMSIKLSAFHSSKKLFKPPAFVTGNDYFFVQPFKPTIHAIHCVEQCKSLNSDTAAATCLSLAPLWDDE